MDVTIIQTCDATFYYPMLQETAKTVRRYCGDNGFRYEQFVGTKRGTMPWHSTYNRIYMLKEMLDRNVRGWVLYMDADSMVVDQKFDLRDYLERHDHLAGIFSGYQASPLPYAINAGGFAINLEHPVGRSLIYDYWKITAALTDAEFDNAIFWGPDVFEDQYLLHLVLEKYVEDKGCGVHFLFEKADESFVNQGPFISQILRVAHSDFACRLSAIRDRVAQILAVLPPERDARSPGIFLSASHPRLATECGDKRHSAIRSSGAGGMLLYGPYIDLPSGQWRARVYGEVRVKTDDTAATFGSDVSAGAGDRHLSQVTLHFPRSHKGIIVEHQFEIAQEVSGLEVRVRIEPGQHVTIHALELLSSRH